MARPRQDNTASTAPNKQRLSHLAIKNLKPRERPYTVWDLTQRGARRKAGCFTDVGLGFYPPPHK